jgi:predicted Zn-dependent protease
MRKIMQKQYKSLFAAIVAILFFANSCLAAFTLEDERKVGKEFYDKLNENNFLIKDRQLNDYITQIGNRVLAQSKKAPFNYTFSIVDSSAINAFATPGGYIYIHKGLISAVDTEAELAGVIAHELAHANARHIASIVDKSTKLNIAALAAIIAAAFLGGGGEATAAIAAFSMAGAGSLTLKYQREHEEEADRLGISYLSNAGYNPEATVGFLRLIKRHEFLSRSIPSYLRTHPGTDERIFYLEGLLLTQYTQPGKNTIIGNLKRMQALLPLSMADLNLRQRQLSSSLAKEPNDVDLLYALAITEDRLGQSSAALARLQKALSLAPSDKDVLKQTGLIYLKMSNAEQAKIYLQKAANIDNDDNEIKLALGKAYFALENYNSALNNFLAVKFAPADDVDINYHIAMSYGKLDYPGDSHYHFGLYFKNEKKTQSALFHFKEALNYFPQNSAKADIINKEIKELSDPKATKPQVKKSN